jgi:hypothetical protein
MTQNVLGPAAGVAPAARARKIDRLGGSIISKIRADQPNFQAPRNEAAIHHTVIAHLQQRGVPGVFFFHPANGGYRRKIEAKILQGLGVVPGVPDVIIIYQGRKAPDGRATSEQLEVVAAMEAAGAYCCIAEGLDRALAVLEAWGLLRGRISGGAP